MNNTNKIGSGIRFADWAVVILAIVLYFKTAEVLAYFAPQSLNDLIGTNVSWAYGLVTAFFIEGVALAYHFYPGARVYTPAVVVKWILIVLSGICQVFDAKIVTGVLNGMTDAQKFFFLYGIPLLPWFVLILLFFVGEIPNATTRTPWRGLKNYLPDPKAIWEGKQNTEFSPKEVVQITPDMQGYSLEDFDPDEYEKIVKQNAESGKNGKNGKNGKVTNPTSRQP